MNMERSKRLLLGFMAVIILSAPIAAQCAEMEIIFSHLVPEVSPIAKIAQEWGDRLEKESGGQVKVTFYWAGSLIPPGDTYKSILVGVADVSFYPPDPNIQALSYVMQLPFIGIPSMKAGSEIFSKMLDKFPEMANEYKGLKILSPRMGPASHIHTLKKPLKTPDDFKGLKIRSAQDKRLATYVKLAGGTPVEVPPPDLYLSLERGIVDGAYLSFPAVNAWRVTSLMNYHNVFGSGGIAGDVDILAFRLETFKKLPPDVQKIIEDLEPWYTEAMINADLAIEEMTVAEAKKMGHTINYIAPEDIKAWAAIAKPIHQEWVKTMSSKGYNAQAIYDDLQRLIAQY